MEEQKRRRERKSAAYWLSKSSILYPICILYVMYVKQVEVYITECSVHISSGTMLFAYALCLILWLASPIRSKTLLDAVSMMKPIAWASMFMITDLVAGDGRIM